MTGAADKREGSAAAALPARLLATRLLDYALQAEANARECDAEGAAEYTAEARDLRLAANTLNGLMTALAQIAFLRPVGATPRVVRGDLVEHIERIALAALTLAEATLCPRCGRDANSTSPCGVGGCPLGNEL